MPAKILLVDDDAGVRDMLKTVLNADGFDIDPVEKIEEALELMASNEYDIMLIDKNMPGFGRYDEGGIELLRYVRQHYPSSEVIIMTGYPTVDTAIEAMKLGAFDYIYKPFSLEDLRLKIKRLSKFRTFINPEYAIGVYSRVQSKMLELTEHGSEMSNDELDRALLSVNCEIDELFSALKESERVILRERESLSQISTLAEQLKMNLAETDGNFDFVEKICRLSTERL